MPIICFASPKGGVGKTTLAANVAGELAREGVRVVAVDLDPQNALRLHLGIPLDDPASFTRHLPDDPDWRPLLRRTSTGVNLLAHGPCSLEEGNALGAAIARHPDLLAAPLREIAAQPNTWVVADTMPGPSHQLSAVLPLADLAVTTLLADSASISLIGSVESGRAFGQALPSRRIAYALNQVDPRTKLGPLIAQGVSARLGARLLGMVRRDEWVGEAAAAQKLIADYAPGAASAHDIRQLARAIARLAVSNKDRQPAVQDRSTPISNRTRADACL